MGAHATEQWRDGVARQQACDAHEDHGLAVRADGTDRWLLRTFVHSLAGDPKSKLAHATAAKDNMVLVIGEITTQTQIDYETLDWPDKNQPTKRDEFDFKQNELEKIVIPIMMKAST